ncbi:unnamed protein product [Staurois parvus]|uniref:Uncharacterized protein n=1 Tax=Staurois parvus TaxID=386267 RepID=A0ABN9AVK9_9NEOB|nr:unnamed protein product [Staurois parvus]
MNRDLTKEILYSDRCPPDTAGTGTVAAYGSKYPYLEMQNHVYITHTVLHTHATP